MLLTVIGGIIILILLMILNRLSITRKDKREDIMKRNKEIIKQLEHINRKLGE